MAAEKSEDESFCIYNTVTAAILHPGKRTFRRKPVRSLKPLANTVDETPPFPLLLGESIPYMGRRMRYPLNIEFEAWPYAPRTWSHWRNRLSCRHVRTWRKARIREAIQSSLYHAPPKQDFILELVKHWCPSTNTFVFPYGEVTITLEDVWVLGGYSVLGAPVSLPLKAKSVEKVDKMLEFQIDMLDRDPENEKTEQMNWMEYFMNDQIEKKEHDKELEHVAFLSMWLSKFVFPYKDSHSAINRDVFAIAVHLSEGTRLALAPAVLAGVYHFMSLLKEKAFLPVPIPKGMEIDDTETIAGPFELIHQWVLERFPCLAPPPRALEKGEPRAARWHKHELILNSTNIVSGLWEHQKIFQWRPYASGLLNWASHYGSFERTVVNGSGSEQDLSFGLCLCACELEGVAEVPNQKYMPHRVTRQFGMDQHLPGDFADMKPKRIEKFSFFVPSRGRKPSQSLGYCTWWQDSFNAYAFEDNTQAAIIAAHHIHVLQ